MNWKTATRASGSADRRSGSWKAAPARISTRATVSGLVEACIRPSRVGKRTMPIVPVSAKNAPSGISTAVAQSVGVMRPPLGESGGGQRRDEAEQRDADHHPGVGGVAPVGDLQPDEADQQ